MVLGPSPLYISCLRNLFTLLPANPLGVNASNQRNRPSYDLRSDDAYVKWETSPGNIDGILWICGPRGSGRSDLACRASEIAAKVIKDTIVISHTFDLKDDRYRSTYQMYASLSYQLLCLRPSLFSHIVLLYQDITKAAETPTITVDQLWSIFCTLLSSSGYGNVICIINNIDESETSKRTFLWEILEIPKRNIPTFRLAITCSSESKLNTKMTEGNVICLENHLMEKQEIKEFIQDDIIELIRKRPLFSGFEESISHRACSSTGSLHEAKLFLTLLHVVDLKSTKNAVSYALNSSSVEEPELHRRLLSLTLKGDHTMLQTTSLESFQTALPKSSGTTSSKFTQTTSPESQWRLGILIWMTYSYRPLTVNEMSAAAAFKLDEANPFLAPSASEFEGRILRDAESDLRHAFGQLIQIETGKISFKHKSWHNYLIRELRWGTEETHSKSKAKFHAFIAHCCLSYMLLICNNENDEMKSPLSGLLLYAVQYWPSHYREAHLDGTNPADFQCFFDNLKLMDFWCGKFAGYQPSLAKRLINTPLTMAIQVGCRDLVDTLLKNTPHLPGNLFLPLRVAVEEGQDLLLKTLLKRENSNNYLLHVAAARGHDSLITVLYELGFSISEVEKPSMYTPLHFAAQCGSLKVVDKLLAFPKFNSSLIEKKSIEGFTPLHIAIRFGHLDVAERLLSNKADRNAISNLGLTPLHIACEWQQYDAIKMLLNHKSKLIHVDNKGRTPLHLAVRTGRVDIVRRLLGSIMNDQFKDEILKIQDFHDSSTPLHTATTLGHIAIVEELLKQSKTTSSAAELKDARGCVPLHLAARSGYSDIVRLLIKFSSKEIETTDVESSNPIHLAVQGDHLEVIRILCQQQVQQYALDVFSSIGSSGEVQSALTPLHLACHKGNSDIVDLLLFYGAHAEITGTYNSISLYTPLHISCSRGFRDIIEKLINRGANPMATTANGSTPLHCAATYGHEQIVVYLMDLIYDINVQDQQGRLPIHLAAQHGHHEVLKKLYFRAADIDATDNIGRTILHYACEGGSIRCVNSLLNENFYYQANIHAEDDNGQTPLHTAAEKGHSKIVGVLLQKGANQGAVDKQGRTPLHAATGKGHIEIVKMLLQKDVDVNTQDDNDQTPLHIAAEKGHFEIVHLLLQKGANQHLVDKQDHAPLMLARDGGIIETLLKTMGTDSHRNEKPLLLAAARDGHSGVTALLLETPGANPNVINDDGQTAISIAARYGHTQVVRKLLNAENIDPNIADDFGRTPISYAAEHNHIGVLELLLEKHSPDSEDRKGCTPMSYAAKNGHNMVIKMLIQKKGDLERGTKAPFWYAASEGHERTIQDLLIYKADPNAKDEDGRTGLHMAAFKNYPEVASAILHAHEFKDANHLDNNNCTAIFTAVLHSSTATLSVLLNSDKIDKEVLGPSNRRPIHAAYGYLPIMTLLLRANVEKNAIDENGDTALALAVRNDHDDVARELLDNGADPCVANNARSTPLHSATAKDNQMLVRSMLEQFGPEKSTYIDMEDRDGQTPFLNSIRSQNIEIINLFLTFLDIKKLPAMQRRNILTAAINTKNENIVESMIQKLKDESEMIPLETFDDLHLYAAEHGDDKVFDMIINLGSADSIKFDDERLFKLATRDGNTWLAEVLIRKPVDLNKLDENGWTLGWIAFSNLDKSDEAEARLKELPDCKFNIPSGWSRSGISNYVSMVETSSSESNLHVVFDNNIIGARITPQIFGVFRVDGLTYCHIALRSPRWFSYSRRRLRAGLRTEYPVPPDKLFYFEIKILEIEAGS